MFNDKKICDESERLGGLVLFLKNFLTPVWHKSEGDIIFRGARKGLDDERWEGIKEGRKEGRNERRRDANAAHRVVYWVCLAASSRVVSFTSSSLYNWCKRRIPTLKYKSCRGVGYVRLSNMALAAV